MNERNEALKARGIMLGGIGLLLFGIGNLIEGSTGIVQSWHMTRHMSDYMPRVTYPEPVTVPDHQGVIVSNGTISIPVPGAEQHTDLVAPEVVCPENTRVGDLTVFRVRATDPDGDALRYQLHVSKQGGREWTFEIGGMMASGDTCTYRNNFTVWGSGTFRVRARVTDATTWSPWSEPQTIICGE